MVRDKNLFNLLNTKPESIMKYLQTYVVP